ncbi:hypothetical protein V8C43DRAFT_273789 [Trichoderma afarasin]
MQLGSLVIGLTDSLECSAAMGRWKRSIWKRIDPWMGSNVCMCEYMRCSTLVKLSTGNISYSGQLHLAPDCNH